MEKTFVKYQKTISILEELRIQLENSGSNPLDAGNIIILRTVLSLLRDIEADLNGMAILLEYKSDSEH